MLGIRLWYQLNFPDSKLMVRANRNRLEVKGCELETARAAWAFGEVPDLETAVLLAMDGELQRKAGKLNFRRLLQDYRFIAKHFSEVEDAAGIFANGADSAPELLRWAVARGSNPAQMVLACRQDLSTDLLEQLARSPDDLIRGEVARNRTTPPFLLEELAEDPFLAVAIGTATNPNTPERALRRLLSVPFVGEFIAVNPAATEEMLHHLALPHPNRLADERVLVAIAGHPNTPPELLAELPDWLVEEVEQAVREEGELPRQLMMPDGVPIELNGPVAEGWPGRNALDHRRPLELA